MILPVVTIAPSENRGRGVFATEDIPAGTLIEVSPVLVLSAEERKQVEKTELFNYIFEWGKKRKKACVAWGYVAVYNHSYNANCVYEMDFKNEEIRIQTVKQIKAGEEMFLNYNGVADDETPIWFEAK